MLPLIQVVVMGEMEVLVGVTGLDIVKGGWGR
jgi:hypothetical protein